MKPLIGITSNANPTEFTITHAYCRQVELAGGVPILLTPTDDEEIMRRQLDTIDGLLLTGGADHNPLLMGEEPLPQLGGINPVRDSHELPLCRMAFNRQMPILGICRGIQTMAIALGGHVMQDIATQHRTKGHTLLKHSQTAPRSECTHSVIINRPSSGAFLSGHGEDTILSEVLSSEKTASQVTSLTPPSEGPGEAFLVNSFHHQAVDNPGPHFFVSATAPDGVIEAIESSEHKPMLGVQWHPENLEAEGLKLFRWLNDEARLFARTKALHQRILTLDSHCDTPMHFPKNVNFLTRDPQILYDLCKMDEGHIDAVTMACYLPQPKFGEKALFPVTKDGVTTMEHISPAQYADYIFDRIEQIVEQSDRLSLARTPQDMYNDKRQGRHSIVLAIENGLALQGDIHLLDHFHQRGVVYVTLCHNGDNDLCDSAKGCQTHSGLSAFGRKVVKRMNELGMIIDMSHAAESSFYDVLKLSEKPIVCSHSNCRALCNHPRNLTDEQMRALAEAGGVMQLTLYPGFVSTDPNADYFTEFFNHLDHAIDIMGIDHVGIGTDFDGDGGIPGIADASELINISRHLLRRGFSERDIEKIWGANWMRVMAEQ